MKNVLPRAATISAERCLSVGHTQRKDTISVFVYICPTHCERNSAHIVRTFPSSFRFVFDIVAHNVVGKKFTVRWRSNYFSNFDHFYSQFNQVFYLELKNIKIFEIEPKLTFLHDVFSWNYFFGGRIPNFLPGM